MEEVRSVVTTDSQGSKTLSPRGLEGQNGRSLDTESQDSEKSYTFRRCRGNLRAGRCNQYHGVKHPLEFNIGADLKNSLKRDPYMVVPYFNHSIGETEAVQGQPGLHRAI